MIEPTFSLTQYGFNIWTPAFAGETDRGEVSSVIPGLDPESRDFMSVL